MHAAGPVGMGQGRIFTFDAEALYDKHSEDLVSKNSCKNWTSLVAPINKAAAFI
jgi:hypothetical protein